VSDDEPERWSAAEVALMLAWAALAVGLLGWALARAGVGAALPGRLRAVDAVRRVERRPRRALERRGL
jgi:hypothetical protein